jgi:hypothetical protein
VEVLDVAPDDEEEEDGAAADLDAQRTGAGWLVKGPGARCGDAAMEAAVSDMVGTLVVHYMQQ